MQCFRILYIVFVFSTSISALAIKQPHRLEEWSVGGLLRREAPHSRETPESSLHEEETLRVPKKVVTETAPQNSDHKTQAHEVEPKTAPQNSDHKTQTHEVEPSSSSGKSSLMRSDEGHAAHPSVMGALASEVVQKSSAGSDRPPTGSDPKAAVASADSSPKTQLEAEASPRQKVDSNANVTSGAATVQEEEVASDYASLGLRDSEIDPDANFKKHKNEAFQMKVTGPSGKEVCLSEVHKGYEVRAVKCSRAHGQHWYWDGSHLKNLKSNNRCLGYSQDDIVAGHGHLLAMFPCVESSGIEACTGWLMDGEGRLKSVDKAHCMAFNEEGGHLNAITQPCGEDQVI